MAEQELRRTASEDLADAFTIILDAVGKERLDEELADFVSRAFSRAISEASSYARLYDDSFDRYQKLFDGRHFAQDQQSTAEPSLVPLNELGNHIRYLASWLTDRTPRLRVFPASDEVGDEDCLLMKRVLTSYFMASRMKRHLAQAYQDALIYGAGFFKLYWDPLADRGAGALRAEAVPPYHVWPAKGMHDLHDGPFFVVRRYLDPYDIDASQVVGVTAPGGEKEDWRGDRAQGGIVVGQYTTVETSPFFTTGTRDMQLPLAEPPEDLKEVYDIWCRLRRPGVIGAWAKVTTDRHAIYGPIQVYSELPFAHFVFQQVRSRRFYGQGLCEILYSPQRCLDEITSMVNRQIHFTADPIWVEEAGARDIGRPGKRRIKPGQVIFVQDGYADRVGFRPPPQLQAAQFEMIQLMMAYFERVTGMNAYMRGMTPQRRELVGVVEAVSEASQVLVRRAADEFEAQVEAALTGGSAIVASSLVAPRRLYLVEDESPDIFIDIPEWPFYTQAGGTPMSFRVHFEAGTSLAISREQRVAQAMRFYSATGGLMGPDWLAGELGIDGAAEVVAEAVAKRQAKEQQKLDAIVEAAGKVRDAARAVLGESDAQDNEGRIRETPQVEEPVPEEAGLDRGQGGALPDELRQVIEAVGLGQARSPVPPPGATQPGVGSPTGGNIPA